MKVLEDRVGEVSGTKRMLRERLNARGDRVMLREQDARELVQHLDFLLDSLLEAQRREREARGLDF